MIHTHQQYMQIAIELAEKGRYSVSPNPMVGCVIVKNGEIIGQGYHKQAGKSHAEIYALKEAGENAQGATMYVTLEPCRHYGRTPPCTSAIIKAGIKKVFIATFDPNPLVAGEGIRALLNAGIDVITNCCEKEARDQNEVFFHFIKTKKPFVISKWAMSLDGKTIVNEKDSKQISCEESQKHTHDTRQQVDAILIGAQTLREDNPELTVRYGTKKFEVFKQPIRVILAGHELFDKDLKIFNSALEGKTIVVATFKDQHIFKFLEAENVEVVAVAESKQGYVSLPHLLEELGKRFITSLLVEGGVKVREAFFAENLVNKIHVYIAPTIIGSLQKKQFYNITQHTQINRDFFFSAVKDQQDV